jgi:hypothetical protein
MMVGYYYLNFFIKTLIKKWRVRVRETRESEEEMMCDKVQEEYGKI